MNKFEIFINKLYNCVFGLLLIILSSISYVRGRMWLNFFLFPQFTIYAIIGFFHAYNVYELKSVIKKDETNLLDLIAYFLVYTAWYNTILLPYSGLGLIESTFVFALFTTSFISTVAGKSVRNPFSGQPPFFMVILGVFLFLAKTFLFYMFKDKIYDQLVTGNQTARNMVFLLSALGLVFLLAQLKRNLVNQFDPSRNISKAGSNMLKKTVEFISNGFKTIIAAGGAIFLLPVILCVGGIAGIFALMKFYNDVMKFVEPLLQLILTTGENKIHYSTVYSLCQTGSMIGVLFYTIHIEQEFKKSCNESIEYNVHYLVAQKTKDTALEDQDKLEIMNNVISQISREGFIDRTKYLTEKGSILIKPMVEKNIKERGL